MTHLNTIIFLILLFTSNLKVFPQESQCPPTLRDIYGFNIGTILQYKSTESSFCCIPPFETVKIEKYSIQNTWQLGDSIYFTRQGLKHEYSTEPPFGDVVSRIYSVINDTIIIVDSVNHFLNACHGDTVQIALEDFYSKIIVDSQNGIPVKSIGGWDNIFEYDGNDSLINAIGYEYEQTFGSGLGLINEYTMIFEYVSSVVLEGYIINGDTTGIISTDSDLINSWQELENNSKIAIFPTQLNDENVITIEGVETPFDVKIFSMEGKEQSFSRLDNNSIVLDNPAIGMYLVIITNHTVSSVQRVIKY